MKCDEKDERMGTCVRLDDALQQLGMLSSITDARRDFLRETRSPCRLVRINTHYVSDVTVGYCMRRTLHRHRLCPYALPHAHRHRTKSENSDSKETPEEPRPGPERSGLKRCQSLESLERAESAEAGAGAGAHELEGVSTRIRRLQVDE